MILFFGVGNNNNERVEEWINRARVYICLNNGHGSYDENYCHFNIHKNQNYVGLMASLRTSQLWINNACECSQLKPDLNCFLTQSHCALARFSGGAGVAHFESGEIFGNSELCRAISVSKTLSTFIFSLALSCCDFDGFHYSSQADSLLFHFSHRVQVLPSSLHFFFLSVTHRTFNMRIRISVVECSFAAIAFRFHSKYVIHIHTMTMEIGETLTFFILFFLCACDKDFGC